jgi:hypothetical protein
LSAVSVAAVSVAVAGKRRCFNVVKGVALGGGDVFGVVGVGVGCPGLRFETFRSRRKFLPAGRRQVLRGQLLVRLSNPVVAADNFQQGSVVFRVAVFDCAAVVVDGVKVVVREENFGRVVVEFESVKRRFFVEAEKSGINDFRILPSMPKTFLSVRP